ncbi:hypothetical protein [Desulfosarcina sp.]|uniref:hypothetical protein n=1 Tax=Desulfosarcina sp. TaxID=2027861 RepID=UPI0035632AD3
MTHDHFKLMSDRNPPKKKNSNKLTYWRSAHNCFSIDYKGIITEICRGDLGYGDMDRLDGAIHAAIGCKQKDKKKCRLIEM